MANHWQKRSQSAQGMVEFALVLPVLLLIILAIFAFGHFFFSYITTISASREAARYGSAMGLSENGIARFTDCEAIRDSAVRVGSIAGLSTVTIYFDDGANQIEVCPMDGGPVAHPELIGLGDRIVVEVVTNYQPIVPLVNIPSFDITSKSTRTILRNVPVGTAAVAMPVQSETKEDTSLTITSDNPDYSKVGVPVEVYWTMTHTGSLAAPTGNVKIIGVDDNSGNGPIDANCEALLTVGHCTITPLTPGPWTITATYDGDALYDGSQDTEGHQVYYFTAVDITSHSPSPSIVGSGVDVQVFYTFTPDPPVTGGYTPSKLLSITDGSTTCNPATNTTGPCVIPAYTDSADRVITISYPVDDPYFLPSIKSVDHVVNAGFSTTTTITGIVYVPPAGQGPKANFEIGDQVKISFRVEGVTPVGEMAKPAGTVRVTDTSGLWCDGTISLTDGTGECLVTLNSRGASGTLMFLARFTPSVTTFDESTSASESVQVDKSTPILTLLGQSPKPSGVNQIVRISFQASPLKGSLMVTGKMRVTVSGESVTCEGTLDTTGAGFCEIKMTQIGDKDIRLDYLGDTNFLPVGKDFLNAHHVDNCPSITNPRFVDTGTVLGKQIDNQIIVTLSNPTNETYQIEEVNAYWPPLALTLYVYELHFGPTGQDASDWECSIDNMGVKPPYCLWDKVGGLTTYYSTAAQGQACLGMAAGGICEPWKTTSQTAANLSLGPATTSGATNKDLYFVISYNAPSYYSYGFKARLSNGSNETCKWIAAEFPRP